MAQFLQDYFSLDEKRYDLENQLHQKQESEDAWIAILHTKSSLVRGQYISNTKMIDEVIKPLFANPFTLSPKQCSDFMSMIDKIYNGGNLDFLLMDDFVEKVILVNYKYNHVSNEGIIFLTNFLSLVQSKYLWAEKVKESYKTAEYGLTFIDGFKGYATDTQLRIIAMMFNDFLSHAEYQLMKRRYDYLDLETAFNLFKKRVDFVSPYITDKTKAFMDNMLLNSYIVITDVFMTFGKRRIYDKDLPIPDLSQIEAKGRLLKICYEFFKEQNDNLQDPNHLMIYSHYLYCSVSLGHILPNEYKLRLENLFLQRKDSTLEKSLYNSNAIIYFLTIGIDLCYSYLMENGDSKYSQEKISSIFNETIAYLSSIPQSGKNTDLSQVTSDYLNDMLPIVHGGEEFVKAIEELFLHQQTFTALHSKMVQLISVSIAKSALKSNPDFFKDTPIYSKDASQKDNFKAAIDYIGDAAFLHDIGKAPFWDLINLQRRKLTDAEFATIKLHSRVGYELLRNNKDLEKYADVAFFHHKFYDGSKGYPENQDNTKSPYRLFTDIVTIADSLDAGTDKLGRNYSVGKSFGDLLKELDNQKGTRYNPLIVNLIKEDASLQKRLSYIVSNGREKEYHEIYTDLTTALIDEETDSEID
jgi:HD-GYP domain-containing protein (c-di-GMP phosphodiesterase class II)